MFNRSNALTYAGVISGTGTVTQAGTGTTILTGANTFTGGTTISSGTLQVGNGATGSIAGDIVDNSALVFNRTGALTYDGDDQRHRHVDQGRDGYSHADGRQHLCRRDHDQYRHPAAGNGGTSGSITGNIVDNGILAINRSDALTVDWHHQRNRRAHQKRAPAR